MCVLGAFLITDYFLFEVERSAEIAKTEAENTRLKEIAETKVRLAEIKAEMASLEVELLEIVVGDDVSEKVEDLAEMDETTASMVLRKELREVARIEAELARIEAELAEIAIKGIEIEGLAEIEEKHTKLTAYASAHTTLTESYKILANAKRAEMEEFDARWAEFDAWQTRIGEIAEEKGVYYKKGFRDGADLDLATLKELFTWVGYLLGGSYDGACALPAGLYPEFEDIETIEDFEDFMDDREFTAYWTQYMNGVFDGTETVYFADWIYDGEYQAASCARDASEFLPFLTENTSFFD